MILTLIMNVWSGWKAYRKHGGMKMRNKTIESIIDEVIEETNYSLDFKSALKSFIKNKFDDNAQESDLRRVLAFLSEDDLKETDEL